jgi:hypothetical protein
MIPPFLNAVTRQGAMPGPGGLLFPKPTLVPLAVGDAVICHHGVPHSSSFNAGPEDRIQVSRVNVSSVCCCLFSTPLGSFGDLNGPGAGARYISGWFGPIDQLDARRHIQLQRWTIGWSGMACAPWRMPKGELRLQQATWRRGCE